MSERKGFHPLVWVGIGCGVLLMLGVVGVVAAGWFVKSKAEQLVENIEKRPVETAARAFAALNPELEFVSADEAAETVTLRNSRSGEVITIDYAQLREGRVSFEGAEGTTTFEADGEQGVSVTSADGTFRLGAGGDLPAWVPLPDGVEAQAAYTSTRDGKSSGTFTVTGSTAAEVLAFYQQTLPDRGYVLESSSSVSGLAEHLVFGDAASGRQITITSTSGQDGVAVSYQERN
ncbi:MAG TPA: hypothetical protein VNB06_16020 [Thermoanaerobaculia bacterium]|nr:hypothetical protein [Thermoanaerobaculia bacterium]